MSDKTITSRNKNTAKSQSDENGKKDVSRKKQPRLSADAKIILSLMKKQPQTTEELCKDAGIKIRNFIENRRDFLINEKIIKKLSGERWAFLDYEPLASKQKYGASDIVPLIEILENDKQCKRIRESAGIKLQKCCSSASEIVGGKTDLRPFFIRILDNFDSNKGIVFTQIHIALEGYVGFQLKGEEDIQWMKDECYPKLLSLFKESGSIKVRHRILRIFSQIYRTDELDMEQRELTRLLRKKFFDPKEDDGIASRCRDILLNWANDELKETLKAEAFSLATSWETFWSRTDDELQEMLEDVVSNMTPSEKETLKKRGLRVMKKHYNF